MTLYQYSNAHIVAIYNIEKQLLLCTRML